MLYTEKTIAALQEQRAAYRRAQADADDQRDALADSLDRLEGLTRAGLEAEIDDEPWPGALPTEEQDARAPVIPFPITWTSHEQARAWALAVLHGVTTFAADGSQISLGPETCSIPVGVVQIGWFENRHADGGDFIKGAHVEVLSPEEFGGESRFGDLEVEWRRFRGEVDAAVRFMRAHQGDERALVFFDGPLVLPFLRYLDVPWQERYISAVEWLLDVSEASGVPLVGYIEPSDARDLTTLVVLLARTGKGGAVKDAALLDRRLVNWGERSRLYAVARNPGTAMTGIQYFRRVHFAYLKITSGGMPTRVEMPDWILRSGRVDWVLDVVRAECVVGIGYPYTLEAADATAVLTARDRERFLGLFQEFAAREDLSLRFSKKALSKRGRRV